MSQHLNPDLGDSAQDALHDVEEQLRSLESRIDGEQEVWLYELTSARANGPHGLPRGTRIETVKDAMQQMKALDQHLESYNLRVSSVYERGVDLEELLIGDLVEPEDKGLKSTELAISYLRRLIISSRLALCVLGAEIRKFEDRMSLALNMVKIMASNIARTFEARKADEGCSWDLLSDVESMVLMLQATMAGVGIKVARQRIIMEYFAKADPNDALSVDATTEQIQQLSLSIYDHRDEAERDEDEFMADATDDDKYLWMRQTRITEYFGRTSWD